MKRALLLSTIAILATISCNKNDDYTPPGKDVNYYGDNKIANCYVVDAGRTVVFNAQRIGKTTEALKEKYDPGKYGTLKPDGHITIEPASVQVKWQTAHGRVEDNAAGKTMLVKSLQFDPMSGKCTVETNNAPNANDVGGSAYLCAYSGENGTGDILWSWHLWVTNEKDPIQLLAADAHCPIVMDRALGAIATGTNAPATDAEAIKRFGMMYQWGRKDPFTPSVKSTYYDEPGEDVQIYKADGTKIDKSTGNQDGEFTASITEIKDIVTTIQNPSIIYINIAESKNMNWWLYNLKTIYDPCPYGYRVSNKYAYKDIIQGTYNDTKDMHAAGVTWNNSWFPASGYLGQYSYFHGVGDYGRYWTASTSNTHSAHFLFIKNTPEQYSQDVSTPRSCAQQLRCQKE